MRHILEIRVNSSGRDVMKEAVVKGVVYWRLESDIRFV
jgi:hypothetical protein